MKLALVGNSSVRSSGGMIVTRDQGLFIDGLVNEKSWSSGFKAWQGAAGIRSFGVGSSGKRPNCLGIGSWKDWAGPHNCYIFSPYGISKTRCALSCSQCHFASGLDPGA